MGCVVGHVSDLEIDSEDCAEILLQFDANLLGHVHVDYLQRVPSRTCRIVGEGGTITWDYYKNEVCLLTADHSEGETFRQESFKRNDMFVEEIRHFLACLEGSQTPVIDVKGAVRVLRVALAARESARTGRLCSVNGEMP